MIFKNKILATILSFVAVANLYAQDDKTNDKIKFATGSWNDILVQAKAENKPIFVDFYTEWCGPCKMMSKQVFTDKEVAKYYNTNFISVKINEETHYHNQP
jgi:thiol:disulfide interchange protein